MKNPIRKAVAFAACMFLLHAGVAHAQKGIQPPTSVATSFASSFPNAQKAKWEKEKEGNYEAEFTLNGQEQSATFLPDGTLKETETEIKKEQVPTAVLNAVQKDHPGAKAHGYERIVRADKSVVYEVEVKIVGKEQDLLYTETGEKTK